MSKQQFCYDYPRPGLTVDIAVVTAEPRPRVLLIERKYEPFAGYWALPGGFVDQGERLEEAAQRELGEETGVRGLALEQIGAFGDPGRDPRGWTVSVVYLARVASPADCPAVAADDAARAGWFAWDELPALAFDHALILQRVQSHLAHLPPRSAGG